MKDITGNSINMKALNTAVLRKALKQSEHSTKHSLAITTGLSDGTCRNILEDLLITGEVVELPLAKPNGGRPARNFAYNYNYSMIALIHLGKENNVRSISCHVGNAIGCIQDKQQQILPKITMESIVDTIMLMIEKFPAIKAIAISYPGVVNDGKIGDWGDLEELFGVDLKSILEHQFSLKFIIENDMNLAARGYLAFQRESISCHNLAYLAFLNETLPGCGIIANGELIRGANGFAGEVVALPFGLSMNEQLVQLRSCEGRIEKIAKTILSLTSIVNPQQIVLCGSMFDTLLQTAIQETCQTSIAKKYLPKLIFKSDLLTDIMSGLTICATDALNSSIRLINK